MLVAFFYTLSPRVNSTLQGKQQSFISCLASFCVIDYAFFHVIQAHTFNPMHGAIEVTRFFAVDLDEGARVFQDLVRGFYLAEELRDFGLDAAVAADIDFPAGIDTD